jgi:hypothetical protein
VKYINEDPECPKDFPFSFSFRVRKIKDSKVSSSFRDYTFACKLKEERDQWLSAFDLLVEFRKLLNAQALR